jgi:hypothetical protein
LPEMAQGIAEPSATRPVIAGTHHQLVESGFRSTLLAMAEKEPTNEKPNDTPPKPDGPKEVEDAARQESEYPEDETNEG